MDTWEWSGNGRNYFTVKDIHIQACGAALICSPGSIRATGLELKNKKKWRQYRKSMQIDGPVVIDFQVEAEENVYPMVAPNSPLNEIITG